MELSDRKKAILKTVVDAYILTAEPVGSRVIAEKMGNALSSATIRNELQSLEELGYLSQPHTSAGRIPTRRGYRFYVDALMEDYRLSAMEVQRIDRMMQMQLSEMERIVTDAGRVVSQLIPYTAVAMLPSPERETIRRFEMFLEGARQCVTVAITSSGRVKNRLFRLQSEISSAELSEVQRIFNDQLTNITMDEVKLPVIVALQRSMPAQAELISSILAFVSEVLNIDDGELVVEGSANILNLPEYQNIDKAKDFFNLLSRHDELQRTMREAAEKADEGVSIVIGSDEQPLAKDVSMVISSYKLGGNARGFIGVIGPQRMDYSRVVSNLNYFTNMLNELLSRFYRDE